MAKNSRATVIRDEYRMSFDEIRAEVAEFASRIEESPEDSREIFVHLHQRLTGLRDEGRPVPDSLERLHDSLLIDFRAESQGR